MYKNKLIASENNYNRAKKKKLLYGFPEESNSIQVQKLSNEVYNNTIQSSLY